MAYLPQSQIVMPARGGISAQTFGISGRFNSIEGLSGFGQACPAGFTMDSTGTCSQPSCDFPYVLSNGVCVTGASIIPGIPDSFVYIGGVALLAAIIFGGMRR